MSRSRNFALTGVSGYIAPRHLKAIKDTGNKLIAAVDPNDSAGVVDSYFDQVRFFTEFERFDRHIEKLRRADETKMVHYLSICSPNHLHDAHARFALRVGASAICEKPLVLNPWNIEPLKELEEENPGRIFTVLQLRVHPAMIKLREALLSQKSSGKKEVELTYITSRGPWYQVSWKGQEERSGGLATNIGIHFFDMLMWFFGAVQGFEVNVATPAKTCGYLELENARVKWLLSVDKDDLPPAAVEANQRTYRSITIDGSEIEFSGGFTELHTIVYQNILAGGGYGLEDARPSIELAHDIRVAKPVGLTANSHPLASKLHS